MAAEAELVPSGPTGPTELVPSGPVLIGSTGPTEPAPSGPIGIGRGKTEVVPIVSFRVGNSTAVDLRDRSKSDAWLLCIGQKHARSSHGGILSGCPHEANLEYIENVSSYTEIPIFSTRRSDRVPIEFAIAKLPELLVELDNQRDHISVRKIFVFGLLTKTIDTIMGFHTHLGLRISELELKHKYEVNLVDSRTFLVGDTRKHRWIPCKTKTTGSSTSTSTCSSSSSSSIFSALEMASKEGLQKYVVFNIMSYSEVGPSIERTCVLGVDPIFHWKGASPKNLKYIDLGPTGKSGSRFEDFPESKFGIPLFQDEHRVLVWEGPEELLAIETEIDLPLGFSGPRRIRYEVEHNELRDPRDLKEPIASRTVALAVIHEMNTLNDSYKDRSEHAIALLDDIRSIGTSSDVLSAVDLLKDFIKEKQASLLAPVRALEKLWAKRDPLLNSLDKLIQRRRRESLETPPKASEEPYRIHSVPLHRHVDFDDD